MNLLPQASGSRPRVACEISPQAVVVARSAAAEAPVEAAARVELNPGAVVPGWRPGNLVDRVEVISALRRALEQLDLRANSRNAELTLVLPDAAVRVVLLDFDALPGRDSDALPIVRFRLKKLLPFDADHARISYQVMSSGRAGVRVLAAAIPLDVLEEYESAVREAGYEPGAVLPSTLSALAASDRTDPVLLVNASLHGVTTAIVDRGVLVLHRGLEFDAHLPFATTAALPPLAALPLVDEHDTAAEWAAQQPLPEHPTAAAAAPPAPAFAPPSPDMEAPSLSREIAQAVSVAAAYFEDTLSVSPSYVLSAGPLGADRLSRILADEGVGSGGLPVLELVESAALLSDAALAAPRAWLGAVTGALRA